MNSPQSTETVDFSHPALDFELLNPSALLAANESSLASLSPDGEPDSPEIYRREITPRPFRSYRNMPR